MSCLTDYVMNFQEAHSNFLQEHYGWMMVNLWLESARNIVLFTKCGVSHDG